MPSLDKAFSDFLKALRGEQSYASLASKLGIAESTLYRLTNRQQSATVRKIEKILSSQNLSLADVFGEEVSKRSRQTLRIYPGIPTLAGLRISP